MPLSMQEIHKDDLLAACGNREVSAADGEQNYGGSSEEINLYSSGFKSKDSLDPSQTASTIIWFLRENTHTFTT